MTTKISTDNIQASSLEELEGGGGTTVYDTFAELPLANNQAGARALVKENSRVYVWNGSGWYNIAVLTEVAYPLP